MPCCASSTSPSGGSAGTGVRCSGSSRSSRWSSGALLAITQTDVKRMLAYSSIAHAGFLLDRLPGARPGRGVSSTMFYLVAYGFTTVGRVRHRDARTRLRRGGHAPVPVGGARTPVAAGGRACSRSSCSPWPASRSPAASPASSPCSRRPSVAARRRWSSSVCSSARSRRSSTCGSSSSCTSRSRPPTVRRSPSPASSTQAAVTAGVVVTLLLGVVPQPLLDLADRASVFIR